MSFAWFYIFSVEILPGQVSKMTSKEIRQVSRKKRNALSEEDRAWKNLCIMKNLRSLSILKCYSSFLCFYPIGSEVNILPFYEELLSNGKALFFPKTDLLKHELSFIRIRDFSEFEAGTMNIPEPTGDDIWDPACKTLSFTPGLAFDWTGHRIGYGGGFYDRFFTAHKEILRMALAYELQIEKEIPAEAWDQPMDYIISDKKIRKTLKGDFRHE